MKENSSKIGGNSTEKVENDPLTVSEPISNDIIGQDNANELNIHTEEIDSNSVNDNITYITEGDIDLTIKPEINELIKKLPKYSATEERINVITHAFGAIVSVVAALSMLIISIKDFTVVRLIGSLVFGVSLIYLYTNSTLYHNEQNHIKRITRQKLDHSSINVLIAGSNTFFLVTGLHSNLGYILCAVNWGLSIISMILNAINVKKFRAPTMVIYILTGWLSIFFAHIILAAIGSAFWVLLAGGLFYTFGLIFYAIKKPYMHAVWHFFVLGGSISHIVAAFMILATV